MLSVLFSYDLFRCFVVFGLVKSCGAIIVFPCCRRQRNNLNEPLDPFPFWVAAEQKGGQKPYTSYTFSIVKSSQCC